MDQIFRNREPRSRDQRVLDKNPEAMQQDRIANRVENHQREVRPYDIIAGATATEFHEPDTRRFNRDFASEDAARREQERIRRENVNNSRRQQAIERDQRRWDQMDKEEQKKGQQLSGMADKWQAGQKNNASMAYNPLTLEYDQTEQGNALYQQDQKKKQWENKRMANIDSKQNSNYNLLTGAPRQQFERH